ncbi:replication-associated recombination protein A [Leptospira sp. GIMC2001]|uniref:replication-associated recombination protein A n=1 Tax=Leptospira sp. GIMC2001 TaxID=1513297 RepID=UPI00234A8D72|nr:replication-associated recombination protein A [Leptospira sp. GIMC2001]WCL51363.1 replication-associated recombination protein A [Leptospira sp. GIMC2001]
MVNLFSSQYIPLAHKLRPENFDLVLGQSRVVRDLMRLSKPVSILFYGPPGSGKTTLANILSRVWGLQTRSLSAVSAGVKDVRDVFQEAEKLGTIALFLDEIHRFSSSQQDSLLEAVETGKIILIGATTENPGFRINRPLLSRLQVFRLDPLSEDSLSELLDKALEKYGEGRSLKEEAKQLLIHSSAMDARKLLTTLEAIISLSSADESIETEQVRSYLDSRVLAYDKNKENHYDLISAFIKSLRGSDPDAAILYMTYMLESGEDPVFIARRLVVFASEDIGNASVHALPLAVACLTVTERIGMPEAGISLAQVTTFLASCPKSNASYLAYNRAKSYITEKISTMIIPNHLRNAPTSIHKKEGAGANYKYPHNDPRGFVEEFYFPDNLRESPPQFYFPTESGMDKNLKNHLKNLWQKLNWKKYD